MGIWEAYAIPAILFVVRHGSQSIPVVATSESQRLRSRRRRGWRMSRASSSVGDPKAETLEHTTGPAARGTCPCPPVSRVTAYSSSLRSRCYELRENCGRRSEGIVGVSGPKKKSPDKLRLRGFWMQVTEAPAFCRIGRKAHTSSAGETSFMVLQRGFDRSKRVKKEWK